MMTPEDRYALQAVLADLEAAAAGIRAILDLGENPYLSREYKIRLAQMQVAATGPVVCLCGLSTTVPCPRHRDPEAKYIEDHQRTSYHPAPARGTPERAQYEGNWTHEDHQDERPTSYREGTVQWEGPGTPSTFARADHERHWFGCDQRHGPEAWCPTAPQWAIDRHNAALRGEHPTPDTQEVRERHYPWAARSATKDDSAAPLMESHRPTPRDVFGAHGEDGVGG